MKLALFGYGKMGKLIEEIARRDQRHVVTHVVTSTSYPDPELLRETDVAIDFTVAGAVLHHLDLCLSAGIPLVIGTTGWYTQLQEAREKCIHAGGTVVYASNFSLGINLFFELNRKLAQLMDRQTAYEPFIHEVHHLQKKDAPSGTAITLANDLLQHVHRKTRWIAGHEGEPGELVILPERKGTVVGIHEVTYVSSDDRIEIRHEAISREGFAKGALMAAEWLKGRKGFFEFRELLALQPA